MTECKACRGDGREFWVEQGGERLRMETCQGCGGSGRIDTVDRLISAYELEDVREVHPDRMAEIEQLFLDEFLGPGVDIPTFLREHRKRQEEDGA